MTRKEDIITIVMTPPASWTIVAITLKRANAVSIALNLERGAAKLPQRVLSTTQIIITLKVTVMNTLNLYNKINYTEL